MILEHATCIELDEIAVLLRGPSGAGKSDLALRLIDQGAKLVADDQVALREQDGQLWASSPAPIAGLIEVRGVGVMRLPYVARARVDFIFELTPGGDFERLPESKTVTLAGVALPCLPLLPFEASAAAKVRLVARWRGGHISRI